MTEYKTVLLPIEVPDCTCCRESKESYRICMYFDNSTGEPICELHLGFLEYSQDGSVKKPKKCLSLHTINIL